MPDIKNRVLLCDSFSIQLTMREACKSHFAYISQYNLLANLYLYLSGRPKKYILGDFLDIFYAKV